MAELMLVNPRRKRRAGRRRKMTAKQLRYFGPRRARRRRRRAPALLAAPVRRRRSRRVTRRRAVSTVRHRRRRVTRLRRNPSRAIRFGGRSFSIRGFLNNSLIPAGVGAAGALGVDIAMAYVTPMLPASLQTGMLRPVVRIAGAIGVGMAVSAVMGKRHGEEATAGALVVTLYDLLKGYAKANLPMIPLSDYDMGWVSPALQAGMGAYVGDGMGAYVSENEGDYIAQ